MLNYFNKKIFILFVFLFSMCAKNSAEKNDGIKEGMSAPDFNAYDEEGVMHSLSEYKGKKLVLYFYPKDDTPGCTKQACTFRNGFEEFKKNNIQIVGVSNDSVKKHKKFKQKHHLPFTLLSDPKEKIIKCYDAYGLFLNKRKTFLIDEHQIIVKIFDNVDVIENAREILSFFAALDSKSKK